MTRLYVDDSFKHGRWLDERPYEWHAGNKMRAHVSSELHCLLDAPRKWRLHREKTGACSHRSNGLPIDLIQSQKQIVKRYFYASYMHVRDSLKCCTHQVTVRFMVGVRQCL